LPKIGPQERLFAREWDNPLKRQKILIRALGGSGTQATIHSAFPYLPEIAYLSILYFFATTKLLKKFTV
jgi:hypothetical protein